MPYISVVTPVYNALNIVDELYKRLVDTLEQITNDFEIIMVNDCCPYGTGEKIFTIAQKDNRVKFIDLARNFGQHIAISAGLDYADGDYVIVMDCDLQDEPAKIPRMLEALKLSGKDAIFAIRQHRKDSFVKRFESKMFNIFMRSLTENFYHCDSGVANFSIITHKVVMAYRSIREHKRSYGSVIKFCGFDIQYIPVESSARFEGSSSYTFFKSLKLAISILLQQSVRPLYVSLVFAILCLATSFFFAGVFVYNYLLGSANVVLLCLGVIFVITLTSSFLFFALSIISLYIANIFEEAKRRPLYIIERTININEREI